MYVVDLLLSLLYYLVLISASIWLSAYIPKRYGYKKLGYFFARCLSLIWLGVFIYIVFKDSFFTKKEALTLLSQENIFLQDDSTLLYNRTVDSAGNSYHTFTLSISRDDWLQLREMILSDDLYEEINSPKIDFLIDYPNRYYGTISYQISENSFSFFKESFRPNGEMKTPTYKRISLSKKRSIIRYQKIY